MSGAEGRWKRILVFAGTTEGRHVCEFLSRYGVPVTACTATEYGGELLEQEQLPAVCVRAGRLGAEEIRGLIDETDASAVIDATHPYADLVSKNIDQACRSRGVCCIRLLREEDADICSVCVKSGADGDAHPDSVRAGGVRVESGTDPAPARDRNPSGKPGGPAAEKAERTSSASGTSSGIVYVDSVTEAAEYLRHRRGNVFVTTGSKELSAYTVLPDYRKRVFARILSAEASMKHAVALGFEGKNLICMQGPFSRELNVAMLRAADARFLVTKESGAAGGFREKAGAAAETGTVLIVVRRPAEIPAENSVPDAEPLSSGDTGSASLPGKEGTRRCGQGRNPGTVSESGKEKRTGEYRRLVLSEGETFRVLAQNLGLRIRREITLAGIGMGSPDGMTEEVLDAIRSADLLAGAKRMIRAGLRVAEKPFLAEYRGGVIGKYLEEHPEYARVTVLLSGDSGFFSGAKSLQEELSGLGSVRMLPGVSSVSYLAARTSVSWEDAAVMSIHGRAGNVIAAVRRSRKLFLLLSGLDSLGHLCGRLIRFGLPDVRLTAGVRLSYADERIVAGRPAEFLSFLNDPGQSADAEPEKSLLDSAEIHTGDSAEIHTGDSAEIRTGDSAKTDAGDDPKGTVKTAAGEDLVTLLIENDTPDASVTFGLPDAAFLRGTAEGRMVPMTKSEVRTAVLSKLRLQRDSVVYDIGAGTGSVSVECARLCEDGMVYAFERKEEAANLVRKNAERFGTENVRVVTGTAPEVLERSGDLPAPTCAFLGGTSGNMLRILTTLKQRNPAVRVVITAVALETLSAACESLRTLDFAGAEMVCVSVSRAEKAGPYHMMKAQNPVWILSAGGKDVT